MLSLEESSLDLVRGERDKSGNQNAAIPTANFSQHGNP